MKHFLYLTVLFATLVPFYGANVLATPAPVAAVEIAKIDGVVWGFDFLDEENILISTREGKLHHFNRTTKKLRPLSASPEVVVKGQGGLLDLRILKEAQKTWVYLTASMRPTLGSESEKRKNTTTVLLRGEWSGSLSEGDIKSLSRLFEARPSVDSGMHFGSRLAFHKDGSVYMTIGERNERDRAQKIDQHWGKVLRLTREGAPFQKVSPVPGALPEIYSYGHRNPQGIAIDANSGDVFINEHGPRGGDEINLIKPGANYGWPLVTHGREYWGPRISDKTEAPNFEKSLKHYVPSIAPSSMLISGGNIIQGALALQHLNVVPISKTASQWSLGEERRLYRDLNERIRSVNQSPGGVLFFGTDSGRLMQFKL